MTRRVGRDEQRSDREIIDLFAERVDALMGRRGIASPTIKDTLKVIDIQMDKICLLSDNGDEEDSRAFLASFRPFLMDHDDVKFERVANLLERHLSDLDLRDVSRDNRVQWKISLRGYTLLRAQDGRPIEGHRLLNLVMYGEVFHSDEELYRDYQAMSEFDRLILHRAVNSMCLACSKVLASQRAVIFDAYQREAFNFV